MNISTQQALIIAGAIIAAAWLLRGCAVVELPQSVTIYVQDSHLLDMKNGVSE